MSLVFFRQEHCQKFCPFFWHWPTHISVGRSLSISGQSKDIFPLSACLSLHLSFPFSFSLSYFSLSYTRVLISFPSDYLLCHLLKFKSLSLRYGESLSPRIHQGSSVHILAGGFRQHGSPCSLGREILWEMTYWLPTSRPVPYRLSHPVPSVPTTSRFTFYKVKALRLK